MLQYKCITVTKLFGFIFTGAIIHCTRSQPKQDLGEFIASTPAPEEVLERKPTPGLRSEYTAAKPQ